MAAKRPTFAADCTGCGDEVLSGETCGCGNLLLTVDGETYCRIGYSGNERKLERNVVVRIYNPPPPATIDDQPAEPSKGVGDDG